MSEPDYRRRAARVLLLDGAQRLLLFEARLDSGDAGDRAATCWFTPGGGIQPGESPAEAAARELREETGLVVDTAAIGDPVAVTSGYASFTWGSGVFRDDFFAVRVEAHDVDVSGFEELEASMIFGHRWWTVDDLRTTTETVFPLGLADLVTDLLADRRPPAPIELPWHHPLTP